MSCAGVGARYNKGRTAQTGACDARLCLNDTVWLHGAPEQNCTYSRSVEQP